MSVSGHAVKGGIAHPPLHPSHAAPGGASSHGTLKTYLIGFGLAAILTIIPFWLVMTGVLDSKRATGMVVAALAIVQIVVHMVYFLHMNTRAEGGWLMMALIFTVVMVIIAVLGSIWVMYHLNTNMMPGQGMSQLP